MHTNIKGQMIGRGEAATGRILNFIFSSPYKNIPSGYEIDEQVKLTKIVKTIPEIGFSSRQVKESLDFVIYKTSGKKRIPIVAVRVNNGNDTNPGHRGEGIARADFIQKDLLLANKIQVVDVNEWECITHDLFNDVVSTSSVWDVVNSFKIARVKL